VQSQAAKLIEACPSLSGGSEGVVAAEELHRHNTCWKAFEKNAAPGLSGSGKARTERARLEAAEKKRRTNLEALTTAVLQKLEESRVVPLTDVALMWEDIVGSVARTTRLRRILLQYWEEQGTALRMATGARGYLVWSMDTERQAADILMTIDAVGGGLLNQRGFEAASAWDSSAVVLSAAALMVRSKSMDRPPHDRRSFILP
jgi:hypothetical protein